MGTGTIEELLTVFLLQAIVVSDIFIVRFIKFLNDETAYSSIYQTDSIKLTVQVACGDKSDGAAFLSGHVIISYLLCPLN